MNIILFLVDVSLFSDESQLKKKRKGVKRKASPRGDSATPAKKKSPSKSKKSRKALKPASKVKQAASTSSASASAPVHASISKKKAQAKAAAAAGRSERAKRRGEQSPSASIKSSPVVDQKKAKVLAKVAGKTAVPAQTNNKKKQRKFYLCSMLRTTLQV